MSIVRTGFNAVSSLCYDHRWDIAKAIPMPLIVGATWIFKPSWLLDPYTNGKGVAFTATFITVAYFVSHLVFQKGWLSYWERINTEATQESKEAKAVRESTKVYEQAKLDLEKAHTAIREIRLKLENATRDKALEVAQSKASFEEREKKAQETLKVRDEFIVASIFPAITALESQELAKLVEEEAQNEHSKIPLVIRRLSAVLEELRQTIHNSETNTKQALNLPQTKEHLSSIISQLKQVIFEFSGNNEELSKQIKKDERTLQQWKENELPALLDRLSENSRLKFSEEEHKKDLAADSEKKSEKMRTLETEIQQAEPQEAKNQYEIADSDCRKREVELELLKSGDVKKPLPSEGFEETSLSLASMSELNKRLQIQSQIAETAQAEADRLKATWKKAAELMGAALKEQRELIARYLLAWKSSLAQEIESKKKRAEDPSGFLSTFLGSNQEESEVKKQKQPKIEAYFSDLSLVLNEWKIQNDQDLSSIVRSHGFRLPIEIPDWHDNEIERLKRIAQFRKNVKLIQALDLIFPSVMSMCAYFEQTKDLKNSELQVHFNNFSAVLCPLGDDFNNTYVTFKRLTGVYFHQDHLRDYAKQQLTEIKDKIEAREKESTGLREHLVLLSRVRDTKKLTYETQNREYLKKRGKYRSLQEQIADIAKELKKIDENSSGIEKTLEVHRKDVEEIKERIRTLTTKIANNKKEFERNKSKLEILTSEKGKLEALADTSATHNVHPSLLEQLHSLQEAFQVALNEAEVAKGAWESKRAALSQNTKDLKEAEETSITKRESKKQELETFQKNFANAIGGRLKVQCDSARYETFSSIRDKCQSAIRFYQWKKNLSKEVTEDMTKETTEKGVAFQKDIELMIQNKIKLARKKQSMNLERARLGNLSCPNETSEMDTARCQFRFHQLEQHKVDQEWRVEPMTDELTNKLKNRMLESFTNEQRVVYQFYCKKIEIASTSTPLPDRIRINQCLVKAYVAILDLMAAKMYVDVERLKDRKPAEEFHVLSELLKSIKGSQDLGNLLTKADLKNDLAALLSKALERDIQVHKNNPKDLPSLSNFYDALKRIAKPFPNIDDGKVPILIAKLELIKHLASKPYKQDNVFNGNFEQYQNTKKLYRETKYDKRTEVERLQKKYIEDKKIYKKYSSDIEARQQISTVEKIRRQPWVEKATYLIPAGALFLLYYTEKINQISMVNGYLSGPTGIIMWGMMTAVHFCFQATFLRSNTLLKEATP